VSVRAAVVGAGFIATRKHIPAYLRRREDVDLVAIADVDGDAAGRVAAQFGIPASYDDVTKMIEVSRPDVLSICTPPRTHVDVALQAITAGCNVLIEKPMAVDTDECDRIIAAAAEHSVQICVAHSDLFYPPFMKAREEIASGAIGTFTGMQIFLSTPQDYMTAKEDHWAHKLPGGLIGETGPHVVYLTLPFIHPIEDVRASGHRRLDYPWLKYDDYRIELAGAQGACSIVSVYNSGQWAAEVEIWGTKGLLKLDLEIMSLVQRRRSTLRPGNLATSGLREAMDLAQGTLVTGTRVALRRYENTHDILIRRFIESLANDTAPPVTADEGREAVRVMTAIASQL
jgi:predicted dehydrogenase